MSGADKRKLAAKKQQEQNEVIKKIPKINEIFAASSTTSNCDATDSVSDEIEPPLGPHDQNESHEATKIIELMEIEAETIEIGRTFEFPVDVALWNIEDNITSLQNYWISKGNVD